MIITVATVRWIHAGLLVLAVLAGIGPVGAGSSAPPAPAPPPAPAGPGPGATPAPADSHAEESTEATPPRISYLHGEVSLWRPGGQDWTAAVLNVPLAPGDVLYAGPAGNLEIQVGPRAFVRGAYGAQIGLDNQEPDFVQLRVTAGYAALDLRELQPGHAVELDTPGAAFTMERAGYYHAEVGADTTTFRTHRGGTATMTPAGGTAQPVAANQQVVVSGGEAPRVETGAAAPLSAWDRWNYQRSDYLIQPASAKYVSAGVYGAEALDQHGSWRTVESYGSVWVPAGVPAGWSPYTTGRWIWDPRFGWTWLDEAPWGWAPYHYGRWVFVGPYWAWAPGPIVVRPVYAPALVVFLGGPVVVGHPLYWAPLGWGEPVIRWWGGPRFVGVAWWGGWGGPRVVNNVVINRTTTVNVTNITVYRNVSVTNAVVGVPADRFGHPGVRPVRLEDASEVRRLAPVRGAPDVRPVAASLAAGSGPATTRPSEAARSHAVVATRAPRDPSPALRSQGLSAGPAAGPQAQQRIVPAPARTVTPQAAPGAAGRSAPGDGPRRDRAGRGGLEGGGGQPAPRRGAAREAGPSRQAVPPAPPGPGVQGAPSGAPGVEGRGEPKARRPTPAERPGRVEGPGRGNPERGSSERSGGEHGAGEKGGPRGERDR
jgi:uncharacterized protein DUF6600